MSSTTAIHSPIVSLTTACIGTNAFAVLATTATESIVSRLKRTALKKTFVMFMPTVFTTRRFAEAVACVTMDMKELEEVATCLQNANHRQTVVITQCATKVCVIATKDMNATLLTCKLCNSFNVDRLKTFFLQMCADWVL